MFENGFWSRFAKLSTLKQVFYSLDWVVSVVIVIIVYIIIGNDIMSYEMDSYLSTATSLSRSLIAITLAGVAIIVSFTDKNVLATLNKIDAYDSLMIVFEFTVMLSLVTTLYGIFIQTYEYGSIEVYSFTFLISYLTFNIFRLVSNIVTFGDKMSQMVMIDQLPEDIADKVGETVEQETNSDDPPEDSSEIEEAESQPD